MKVNIKQLSKESILPNYATKGAAGFDIASCESILILPGQVIAVDTGLAFEIPVGYELQVRSRSGLALKQNIFVLNAPGTIDSDFRGSVKAILCNASNVNFSIKPGDRIAQCVLAAYEVLEPVVIEELSETERGQNGFGSTGIQTRN